MNQEGMILTSSDGSIAAPIIPIFSDAFNGDVVIVRSYSLLNDGIGIGVGVLEIRGADDDSQVHGRWVSRHAGDVGEVPVEPDAVSYLISVN